MLPGKPTSVLTRCSLSVLAGLGADWSSIMVHGADGFACTLEKLDHLFFSEVGAIYRVRVDGIL